MSREPLGPRIRPGVARLFRLGLRRADRIRAEADEEMRLHLALRTEQLVREGLSPDAARAEAERRFGPLDDARARLHASAARREGRIRARERMEAVAQDVRIALRGMRRSPGFVATAVICLALGIGANAATFSLFDELLLRPLPVHEPERLVNLGAPGPVRGSDSCNRAGSCDEVFSYPMFRDLERAQTPFTGLAAHRLVALNFAVHDQTVFGWGEFVSGGYFPVLGLRPALGRLLGPADDDAEGAHPVAVLSHAFWTAGLGADPTVIGQPLLINGRPFTIVGVAPAGFEGTTLGDRPHLYLPLSMASAADVETRESGATTDRRRYWLYLFARLRPGVSIEGARSAMNAIYRPILADVEAPLQKGMSERTLERFKARTLTIEDGRRGQSVLRGETRAPLLLLMAITGLVVLIACANVANLMLARAAARRTELAVRQSLGAGRARLLAQMLVEAMLLAAIGGAASLVVARGTLAAIGALIPTTDIGSGAALSLALRPSAFVFAAAVSLATGIAFGLFPALQSTRPDLISAIRAASGQPSGARAAARFRTSLVTAQIALSTALLIAAGLFVRSLGNVSRVDLGLDTERIVGFGLAPVFNGYSPERSRALFDRVQASVAALPGVTGVAASTVVLLTGNTNGINVRVEGFRRDPDTDANTRTDEVGAGFFRTMGIPLLAGREFTAADRVGAPRVAVANEAFARKFGLGASAVGKRVAIDGQGSGEALDIEIVGLARDSHYSGVKDGEPPILYTPFAQDSTVGGSMFYARATGSPAALIPAIRRAVHDIDPTLPVVALATLSDQARDDVYLDRMIGTLSTAFAALATLLAAVGLYGVLAYTVAQRTREIGVRMALGASGGRVRAMVLAQVGRMTLVGAALGIAGALALGKAAQSLLFGLDAHDPVAIVSSVAVLALVAFVAGFLPAWRASRVEPMRALRAD